MVPFPEPPPGETISTRLFPGLFSFSFVRNLWDRLVLCYRDKVRGEVDGFTEFNPDRGIGASRSTVGNRTCGRPDFTSRCTTGRLSTIGTAMTSAAEVSGRTRSTFLVVLLLIGIGCSCGRSVPDSRKRLRDAISATLNSERYRVHERITKGKRVVDIVNEYEASNRCRRIANGKVFALFVGDVLYQRLEGAKQFRRIRPAPRSCSRAEILGSVDASAATYGSGSFVTSVTSLEPHQTIRLTIKSGRIGSVTIRLAGVTERLVFEYGQDIARVTPPPQRLREP